MKNTTDVREKLKHTSNWKPFSTSASQTNSTATFLVQIWGRIQTRLRSGSVQTLTTLHVPVWQSFDFLSPLSLPLLQSISFLFSAPCLWSRVVQILPHIVTISIKRHWSLMDIVHSGISPAPSPEIKVAICLSHWHLHRAKDNVNAAHSAGVSTQAGRRG